MFFERLFKKIGAYVFISSFLFLVSCQPERANTTSMQKLQGFYNSELSELIASVEVMQSTNDFDSLRAYFIQARKEFKHIEPLMAFFKHNVYKALNQPNLMIIHEGDNGKENEFPQGFQVLEEELFNDSPDSLAVKRQIDNIYHTLSLERKNSQLVNAKPYHFLWAFRAQLVRTMSLGITGFDSPVILNSLPENKEAFISLTEQLDMFNDEFSDLAIKSRIQNRLLGAAQKMNESDFDQFDRYDFIKNELHPLLDDWKSIVEDWRIEFPLKTKLNQKATSFFASNTFNIEQFAPRQSAEFGPEVVNLGKKLFFDRSLSSSGNMSCGSCHQPSLHFTDGKAKSIANDGSQLERNSPTLLYTALQTTQFYDSRVSNLENQIIDVVNNSREFHSDLSKMEESVKAYKPYRDVFDTLYKDGVTARNIRNAMAQYIRSLSPFNSRFDRSINEDENTLTTSEIQGFNLFMGKAGCGTCHFAPIFNGTVPPEFSHTELEVLGTPERAVWENAKVDPDLGRYNLFHARLRKYSFKTPTVRNVEMTGPYMHNGVYQTLEEVVKFYNLGGGAGIGIDLENQTLPPAPLNLSDEEMSQIVSFMKTLTDDISVDGELLSSNNSH